MNVTKITLATLGSAALLLTGVGGMGSAAHAGVAQSSGASAAALPGSLCAIQVHSVRALDVQDNDNVDEIRLRIGDKTSTQRTYSVGQLRNVNGDNTYDLFTSPELVKVVEVDGATTSVIGSATLPCVTRTRTSLVSDATGDAIYEVDWEVDVLVP